MFEPFRSRFIARTPANDIVFRGLACGATLDIHDEVIYVYIKRSRTLGATQFEVVAK